MRQRVLIAVLAINAGLLAVRAIQEARQPATAQTSEIIIDNGQPGTSFQGSWTTSRAPSPFGASSLYNSIGGNWYRWDLALPSAGDYEVYVWWTSLSSRATAAPYTVTHAGGTSTIRVDQRSGGGQWNLLGSFSFGASARIQLATTANFSTSADAVRLVQKSNLEVRVAQLEGWVADLSEQLITQEGQIAMLREIQSRYQAAVVLGNEEPFSEQWCVEEIKSCP